MDKTVIGIDIGGTNIKAGIVTTSGNVIQKINFPTEVLNGKSSIIRRIIGKIREFQQFAAQERLDVIGIGIGTAGYVNQEGVIQGATMNIPGWGGTSLPQEIGPAVDLPVSVDNDANAMAVGEAWLGAGKVWDNFICLTFGTGVGGCLIKDKRPLSWT